MSRSIKLELPEADSDASRLLLTSTVGRRQRTPPDSSSISRLSHALEPSIDMNPRPRHPRPDNHPQRSPNAPCHAPMGGFFDQGHTMVFHGCHFTQVGGDSIYGDRSPSCSSLTPVLTKQLQFRTNDTPTMSSAKIPMTSKLSGQTKAPNRQGWL
jgi:hypothetical protein